MFALQVTKTTLKGGNKFSKFEKKNPQNFS